MSAKNEVNAKLHWSVHQKHEEMTKHLLDIHGADVNSQDSEGLTPLMIAIGNRQESMIKLLLEAGADMTILNHENRSALYMFCADHRSTSTTKMLFFSALRKKFSTSEEAAQCLIDAGCHLYQAVYLRDAKIIEYMLDRGSPCDSTNPINKFTTLHLAVALMNVDMVKLLLKYSENKCNAINKVKRASASVEDKSNDANTFFVDFLNAQGNDGMTALYIAVTRKHVGLIQILLEAGADMTISNRNNVSALHKFCEEHNFPADIRKIFFEKLRKKFDTSEETAQCLINAGCHLYQAVYSNDAKVIEYMLERGFSVNSMLPSSQQTALHLAVSVENVEIVKLLLNYGADFKAPDDRGSIPILYVCQYSLEHTREKIEILQILLKLDVSPMSFNTAGYFQIVPTLVRANDEAIRTVLPHIDFTARCRNSGRNVLHYLAMNRNPGVVEQLKPYLDKFDVNVVDDSNRSPLHTAVKNSNVSMVRFLLSRGVTPNCMQNRYGNTPLYEAYAHFKPQFAEQWDDCLKLLLQYNADPQFIVTNENDEQITVFDAATKTNSLDKMKPVIAHLAVMEELGVSITETTATKMDPYPSLKKYFVECQKLVRKKVCGSVTILKLLTEDKNRISRYSGNEKLMLKLTRLGYKQNLKSAYSYYHRTLNKRIAKGIQHKKFISKSAKIICKIFGGRLDETHLIVNKIVDYLSDDDIFYFMQV